MVEGRDDVAELLASLDNHLAATEELPLEEDANRWLGEAHGVASDLVDDEVSDEIIVERVETVLELLDEVDETGNEDADGHVAAAERAGQRILDRQ